jgi:uncharacterized metal-binding protein
MAEKPECACGGKPTLVFSCSGASDVGEISDRACRKLKAEGAASMYCLAGIGGRVSGIMKTTEAAGRILAVDGCPLDCSAKCLEQAGFSGFLHLRASDAGFKKGKTPVTPEAVETMAAKARSVLASCKGGE